MRYEIGSLKVTNRDLPLAMSLTVGVLNSYPKSSNTVDNFGFFNDRCDQAGMLLTIVN